MKIKFWHQALLPVLFVVFFEIDAYSLNCPHNFQGTCSANQIECSDCHIVHSAAGMTLTSVRGNAALCKSCHTATGQASAKSFSDSEQAQPERSGNSHRWDALVKNSSYGSRVPVAQGAADKDYMNLRLDKQNAADDNTWRHYCSTCHDQHEQTDTPFDPNASSVSGDPGRHFQRYVNDSNQMCRNCHWARDVQDVTSTSPVNNDGANTNYNSHPVRIPLTGTTVRAAPLDANGAAQTGARFKDNGTGDTNWTNNFILDSSSQLNCMTCHWVHYTDSHSGTVDLR
ncbi:MAG TPA: cytochrome c3 family protein [bacterium]